MTTATTLQKSRQTTIARGTTLLTTDGYSVTPVANRPGVYIVTRPADRPVKVGEQDSYTVDVAGGTCECKAFANLGTCKHVRAVTEAVAKALALVGPMLPAPVAVNLNARKEAMPERTGVGRYGSEQWKRSVAADFC